MNEETLTVVGEAYYVLEGALVAAYVCGPEKVITLDLDFRPGPHREEAVAWWQSQFHAAGNEPEFVPVDNFEALEKLKQCGFASHKLRAPTRPSHGPGGRFVGPSHLVMRDDRAHLVFPGTLQ